MSFRATMLAVITALLSLNAFANVSEDIGKRISPVGSICMAGDPCAAAAPTAVAAGGELSGADVYSANCVACHDTGAAGAPKIGDIAAWAPRIDKGVETLHNNAINGIGAMPAMGLCASCSEDDIRNAVDHMIAESSDGTPVAAAPAGPSGEEIYNTNCLACHNTGAAGAPKLGDVAAWAPRIEQGIETLYTHAIDGFNAMPALGLCATCSPDDIKVTVDYMVAESQ